MVLIFGIPAFSRPFWSAPLLPVALPNIPFQSTRLVKKYSHSITFSNLETPDVKGRPHLLFCTVALMIIEILVNFN